MTTWMIFMVHYDGYIHAGSVMIIIMQNKGFNGLEYVPMQVKLT